MTASNPFEARVGDDCLAVFDLPPRLVDLLAGDCRLGQLVGASGMGKSTHLWAIARHLTAAGTSVTSERLNRGEPAPPLPAADCWLLDEAQWLSDSALVALVSAALSAGRRLWLGTHCDHRRVLRRLGVRLETVPLRGLRRPAELAELVGRYLAAAAVPRAMPLTGPGLRRWWRASGGNVGAALRLGYELAEDLPSGAPVTAAAVDAAARRLRQEAPAVLDWRALERWHRR